MSVLQPIWAESSFGGVVVELSFVITVGRFGIGISDLRSRLEKKKRNSTYVKAYIQVYCQFSIRTEDTMQSVSFLIQFLINLAIVICYVAILLGVRSNTKRRESVSFVC